MFDNVRLFADENLALRQKNLHTIKRYMEGFKPDMSDMFTEDFSTGVVYDFRKQAMTITDAAMQRDMEASICKMYPDWTWSNLELYQSDDPNVFVVECDGRGTVVDEDGKPVRLHKDHYLHIFTMRDGLIKDYREVNNPLNEIREMGYKVPFPDEL